MTHWRYCLDCWWDAWDLNVKLSNQNSEGSWIMGTTLYDKFRSNYFFLLHNLSLHRSASDYKLEPRATTRMDKFDDTSLCISLFNPKVTQKTWCEQPNNLPRLFLIHHEINCWRCFPPSSSRVGVFSSCILHVCVTVRFLLLIQLFLVGVRDGTKYVF